jgi:hypothetical protein
MGPGAQVHITRVFRPSTMLFTGAKMTPAPLREQRVLRQLLRISYSPLRLPVKPWRRAQRFLLCQLQAKRTKAAGAVSSCDHHRFGYGLACHRILGEKKQTIHATPRYITRYHSS